MAFRSQFITGLLCCVLAAPLSASEFEKVIQPFFQKHCIKCHGPEKSKGDVRLDKFPGVIADDYAAEHWQEVLDVLNGAEMPPKKEPQPGTKELTAARCDDGRLARCTEKAGRSQIRHPPAPEQT